jgi:hypothetical protein
VGNNSGDNGLNSSTLYSISTNPAWATTALQISSTNHNGGWGTVDTGILATWFGANRWAWTT